MAKQITVVNPRPGMKLQRTTITTTTERLVRCPCGLPKEPCGKSTLPM